MKCKRYWQKIGVFGFSGNVTSGLNYNAFASYPVDFRAAPSAAGANQGASNFPTAAGTLTPNIYGVSEFRTANGSGSGFYQTVITLSARM